MSDHKVKLLSPAFSTCGRRVLTTLEESGLPYELVPVDFAKGEHKSAEWLEKQHPFGQVPSFWDGDYHIVESRAIARYVALKAGNTDFYPANDIKKLGLVEQWISFEQSNHKAAEDLVVELFFKPVFFNAPTNEDNVVDAKKRLEAFYTIVDKHLATSQFLAGDKFTLADACFLPYTQYLLQVFPEAHKGFDNVARWWKECSSRPSWQKVLSLQN